MIIIMSSFHLAKAEEQALDDQEIINIESLYKSSSSDTKINSAVTEEKNVSTNSSDTINPDENTNVNDEKKTEAVNKEKTKEKIKDEKVERLTDLNKLSPFREVSVIQKKYLPKSGRLQAFIGGGTTTNSPWFSNLGLKLNVGYFFSESFGIEASGIFLTNSERDVAKEIRENNGLQPEKFVNTKSNVGVDIVWVPIYGKVSYSNDQIIPFDMYFTAGLGSSSTNSKEGNNSTFHIGTGQIFAISKGMAFRWDYSWNMYQATPLSDSALATANSQSNMYNDLILTAGFSFFFPEVSNR